MPFDINAYPPAFIHEPPNTARSAVIWLHGLGANGNDFDDLLPYFPQAEKHIRFVFPNALILPITINSGMPMPAWYDIKELSLRDADSINIQNSTDYVHALIKQQIKQGITSNKIIVAGFSQGGAIAIRAGLSYEQPLGGVLALSCYLLERDSFAHYAKPTNLKTPILMIHGSEDDVVPFQLGKESAEFLQQAGYPVEFKTYPMRHQMLMPEVNDIATWLNARL